jgi:hypothetical protein
MTAEEAKNYDEDNDKSICPGSVSVWCREGTRHNYDSKAISEDEIEEYDPEYIIDDGKE